MNKKPRKSAKGKKIHLLIFFLIGISLFLYFLYSFGLNALDLIVQDFNLHYLLIFLGISLLGFLPLVWRWQVVLNAYKIKGNFWTLLKNTMAGFAVSYTTPLSRLGGEPVRIYILKKKLGVNYKTGSATVLIDRYMELLGTTGYSILALIVLLLAPGIPLAVKVGFGVMNAILIPLVIIVLYRFAKRKGVFLFLYDFLRFYKIKKWKGFRKELSRVDVLMEDFFVHHKKQFFLSLFFYLVSGVLWLLEFKYLLLTIGVETTITDLILVSTVIGIANFIPVPGQLGFLEAGQTGLFQILRGNGNVGFALALLLRLRSVILVGLGYLFIAEFSLKEYLKK